MSLILDALRKAQQERKAIYVKEQGKNFINFGKPRKAFYFLLGIGLCLCLIIFLLPVPKKTGTDYTKMVTAKIEKPLIDLKDIPKEVQKKPKKGDLINTSIAGNKESIKSAGEIKKSVVSKKDKEMDEAHKVDNTLESKNSENVDVMVKKSNENRIINLFNKAVAETNKGNLDTARDIYLKILEEKPDYIEVLNNLGVIAMSQGNTKEAISYYRKILEKLPNYSKAYNNMAIALLKGGDKKLAEEYLKKAIEINREGIEAYINLLGLLRSEKRLKEAVNILEPIIKKGYENPNLYLSYAIIMDEMGNINEATLYYRYYLRLSSKSEERNKVLERLKILEDRDVTKNP